MFEAKTSHLEDNDDLSDSFFAFEESVEELIDFTCVIVVVAHAKQFSLQGEGKSFNPLNSTVAVSVMDAQMSARNLILPTATLFII